MVHTLCLKLNEPCGLQLPKLSHPSAGANLGMILASNQQLVRGSLLAL